MANGDSNVGLVTSVSLSSSEKRGRRRAIKKGREIILPVVCVLIILTGAVIVVRPGAMTDPRSARQQVGWESPTGLDTNDSVDSYSPSIATDPAGNAIAVWLNSGDRVDICSARYAVGTGWGTEEPISENLDGASPPAIVIDGSGNAMALWFQYDGALANLSACRSPAGSGWETPQMIETDSAMIPATPAMDMNDDGLAIAVWFEYYGSEFQVLSVRYDPSSGWTDVELVGSNVSNTAISPRVALDGSGNALVTWIEENGTIYSSGWSNTYTQGGGWGTPTLFSTSNDTGVISAELDADPAGDFFVVWTESSGSEIRVWANRYVWGSGWETAEQLNQNDTSFASDPVVCTDEGGNSTAVWIRFDGVIWASRYVSGSGWGNPEQIAENSTDFIGLPMLDVDPRGDVMLVWLQYDSNQSIVWTARWSAISGWGSPVMITPEGEQAVVNDLAVDDWGNAFIVWEDWNGVSVDIYGIRYESAEPIPEFGSLVPAIVALTMFVLVARMAGRRRGREPQP